jgi:hypothetical protein
LITLSLKHEPRVWRPEIEIALEHLMKFLTDNDEPKETKSRTLICLPNWPMLLQLTVEPRAAKPKVEIELLEP